MVSVDLDCLFAGGPTTLILAFFFFSSFCCERFEGHFQMVCQLTLVITYSCSGSFCFLLVIVNVLRPSACCENYLRCFLQAFYCESSKTVHQLEDKKSGVLSLLIFDACKKWVCCHALFLCIAALFLSAAVSFFFFFRQARQQCFEPSGLVNHFYFHFHYFHFLFVVVCVHFFLFLSYRVFH